MAPCFFIIPLNSSLSIDESVLFLLFRVRHFILGGRFIMKPPSLQAVDTERGLLQWIYVSTNIQLVVMPATQENREIASCWSLYNVNR
jgi:hypothetical protein